MKASVLLGVLLLQVVTCGGISVEIINNELDKVENEIDNKLFLYESPMGGWLPSSVYKYADLRESLDVMATEGVAGKKFYIGEDVTNGHVYGMVNIAAFLAQSMKETIKYDACDENSWDLVGGKYPLSNACGQLGQSYQDYHCSEEEKHMECPVDPNMSITAVTHAKWYGAPAPLYCGPKTDEQPFSGFWDYGYECNKSWANPPEYCDVYEGQKAGKFDQSRPYANTAGRTDVEGCCWWGRGVIQTTGICNFGKLNYYLGARAAEEGRPSRYPSIDFCKDPEQICSSSKYKELKWVAGMFYWMESVQSYNEGGWKYMDELAKFVEGGMQGTAFIDAVSGIVNRGCHNPPCGTGALDGGHERSQNFKKVLETFFAGSPPEVSGSTTTSMIDAPTPSPSRLSLSFPTPTTQVSGTSNVDESTIASTETNTPPSPPAFISGLSVEIINNELDKVENEIDNKLFLYESPMGGWLPSSVYKYADLRESLDVMATEGVAGKKFYIGEDVTNGHVYGMVNIAAFLAQSMKETIKYDACDENSWDLVGGKYPLSNACGQLGQSYQDYHCSEEEKHMECPVDPNMSITAVTHAKWYGAPAPLYCGPKTDEQPFSGFWDYGYECNISWANPPEYCDVYEGQKAGKFDQSRPYANTAGRTDVEGCCWWGRGVIQTTGVCNFGKLNYYLGARAAEEGRPSRYPTIDFCKDPEQICSSSAFKELKWVAGMFYWMESVQSYNEGGWKYMDELAKFVEGGMQGTAFIDAVSGIVNRGCHNPPCGTGALDGGHERSQNFKKVLETFFAGSPPEVSGSTTTTSNVDEPSIPSSPTSSTPSPPSSPTQINGGDKWYPDYSLVWAEGKCLNAYPAPSGRPHYDSQKECCDKAYGNQASGVCLGAISSSSEENLSPTPQSSLTVFVAEETLRPTSKPVASFSIEGTSKDPTPVPSSNITPPPPQAQPTPIPTRKPSPRPSPPPQPQPTPIPTRKPSPRPSPPPQPQPTPYPTRNPSPWPSPQPTPYPARNPSPRPSLKPTPNPTSYPSSWPSPLPTVPSLANQMSDSVGNFSSPTQGTSSNMSVTPQPTSNTFAILEGPSSPTQDLPTDISNAPTPQVSSQTGWYVDKNECRPGQSIKMKYTSASDCCTNELNWMDIGLCVSRSTGVPTNMFYGDAKAGVCRQDCAAEAGLPCGGSPLDLLVTLHTSLESCCITNIPWEPSCVDLSLGNERPGTGLYYVNWNYEQCALDCPEGSAAGCGGLAPLWATKHGTADSCCSTIAWSTNCVYGVTANSTGTGTNITGATLSSNSTTFPSNKDDEAVEEGSISDHTDKTSVNAHNSVNAVQSHSGLPAWVAVICCLLGFVFGVAIRHVAQMINDKRAHPEDVTIDTFIRKETVETKFSGRSVSVESSSDFSSDDQPQLESPLELFNAMGIFSAVNVDQGSVDETDGPSLPPPPPPRRGSVLSDQKKGDQAAAGAVPPPPPRRRTVSVLPDEASASTFASVANEKDEGVKGNQAAAGGIPPPPPPDEATLECDESIRKLWKSYKHGAMSQEDVVTALRTEEEVVAEEFTEAEEGARYSHGAGVNDELDGNPGLESVLDSSNKSNESLEKVLKSVRLLQSKIHEHSRYIK